MVIVLFVTVFLVIIGIFVYAVFAVYRQDESIRKAITIQRGNAICAKVIRGNSTYNFLLPYNDFSIGLSDTTLKLMVEEAVIRAVNANPPGKEKAEHEFSITSQFANQANKFHAQRIINA